MTKYFAWSPRLAASLIFAIGGLAIYLINFPGSMEDDSFVQLLEGRTESYSNWHPPVMSWLLGLSDGLPGPPSGWFIALIMAMVFMSLIGVLVMARRVTWTAAAAAALMLALPQLFLLQAVVWKDTLFANAVLAGFVAMGLAAKWWRILVARIGLLLLAAAFFALASLARQNGVVVMPCAVVIAAILTARHSGTKAAILYAFAFAAASLFFWQGANALLQMRSDGYPAREEQFKVLELYDLTGMVVHDRSTKLTILAREAPQLEKIIRSEGVARWSPLKNDTLQMSPRIVSALEATPADVLSRQWKAALQRYPARYLAVRSLLFRWVYQQPDVALCHPFHVGDQGDAEDLKELGIKPRLDARDVMLWRIGDVFLKTPVFSHGLFSLIAIGVAAVLLRRRQDGDIVIAGLIVSAFAFTATFFVISIACDYRYLYLIDLSALAGLLYLAADPPQKIEGPKAL